MPASTARAIRAAVSQTLKIDDNWENVDVLLLDVNRLIARFRNLSKLAPGSLATYESRFRSGLESYLAYLDNPRPINPELANLLSAMKSPPRRRRRGRPFSQVPASRIPPLTCR